MADTVLDTVKRDSGWSIALGFLMILAGIIAICAPLIAGVVIVYVVAWTAIFNGGFQLVYAFRAHSGGRMILEILLGLLYIVAGVFILMHPGGGLLALTLIIASFLLIYGVFALVLAFQMRPRSGWGWILWRSHREALAIEQRMGCGHAGRHQLHRVWCLAADAVAGRSEACYPGGISPNAIVNGVAVRERTALF
jgi:uncharacterized membrane protein HdeD (DUF308 family)